MEKLKLLVVSRILSFVFIISSVPHCLAAGVSELELGDLALPSEVREIGKQSGSIYYSPSAKNKTLMPVHFWGEVGRPGLHFIPVDTSLVKGLSFAGGGGSTADLEDVTLNRIESGKIIKKEFDLTAGGDIEAHEFSLKPGDTVFIKKDRYIENRAFYTGLIAVAMTFLSAILIYKRIEQTR